VPISSTGLSWSLRVMGYETYHLGALSRDALLRLFQPTFGLHHDVKPPPQVLQTDRRRLSWRPCLPCCRRRATSRAPSLRRHYPASSLLRIHPPPSRHRTISRDHRLYARSDSADFAAGRGGFLQLLDASVSPCCRSKPRRSEPPRQPDCVGPCCLRGVIGRSASGVGIFRGHLTFTCVTAR
jgi:hypothetical protein